ncbi:hypothetical protein [Salibacterium halotolerans]|uniref:Uncharacterized protein n=1 Tax=Salibacterium halotolerans TaxID=1884432 RepID=A0A1I5MFE2_9BACI|nr:hypothetical protein [Salibacterium halotolerans]SFP08305.1 hypothetical protein SAMN05518683_102217 [Salibacterium halotolerans]
MSWKAVELQVALPRTQDAGKLQEQLQQRGQAAQDRMAAQEEKELEKQRTQVLDPAGSEKSRLESGENGQLPVNNERSTQTPGAAEETNRPGHPFKGKLIDITG